MSALMVAPQVLPFRWQPESRFAPADIDVRLIIAEQGALFFAEDICRALGLEIDATRFHTPDGMPMIRRLYPGRTQFVTELVDVDGEPIPVYDEGHIYELAEPLRYQYVRDFLGWLERLADRYTVRDAEEAVELYLDELRAPLRESHAGETYSVAIAAKYLSRDPQIAVGRDSLFHIMRDLGWLARDHETWIPSTAMLTGGMLIRYRSRTRGRKDAYPQVRITVHGMEQLHKALAGVAPLNLDDDTQLTLVELP